MSNYYALHISHSTSVTDRQTDGWIDRRQPRQQLDRYLSTVG